MVAVEEPRSVGDFPPVAGPLGGVATTLPWTSRRMEPSLILIGTRNPLPPGKPPGTLTGATTEPETRQKWHLRQLPKVARSQLREPRPSDSLDSSRPLEANLQAEAPRPTPSDRPRHRIRAWGSRGRRFKSGRPDHCIAGQRPLCRGGKVASRSFDRTLTAGFLQHSSVCDPGRCWTSRFRVLGNSLRTRFRLLGITRPHHTVSLIL
jgi:hypothetical protein